jgi:hypothetical protein
MEKTAEKRLLRSEVPVELTWNLDDLFVSEKAWKAELDVIERDAVKIEQFKGN